MARGVPKSEAQKEAEARKSQALNDFISILQETNGLQDISPENQEQIDRLNAVAKELGISSGSLARKFTNAMKAGTFDEDFMTDLGFEEGQASPEQLSEMFRLLDVDSASEDPKIKSEKPSFGKFFQDMADKVNGLIPGGRKLSKKNQAILDKERAKLAAAKAEREERSRTDPNSFANRLAAIEQSDQFGIPALYRVEGAMEGISPNQPPVAIDAKTKQPVQNPRRSLIPATLERFLGRKRVSGGQPIANATVEPVKPLKDDQGNLIPGRREVNELGEPAQGSGLVNVRNVAVEEPEVGNGSSNWSPSGENRVRLGGAPLEAFGSDYGPNRKKENQTKSLYLFRTKEALKSYIQLKNIDTNKYVVVPIPSHLRDNIYLKSVNFNISNPSFKYMMILKSYVIVTGDAKPVLKVQELKQNEDAKKNNNSHSEKKNPEFIKKYGKMNTKGGMKDFLAEKYEDGEIPEDYEKTSEHAQAQKELEDKKETKPKQASFSSLIELPITKSKNSKDKDKKKKQAVAIAMSESGKGKKNKSTEKGLIEFDDIIDVEDTSVAANLPESKHKMEGINKSLKDACWEGYEAIGTKMKNGKKVPNCVPKSKSKK